MTRTSDRITTYYLNARELVKQNQAKAARDYVLRVLNEAYAIYKNPRASILTKAKTAAFIRKWIVVDRELCQVGITEYVLECFALLPEYLHLAVSPKTTVQPKAAPKAAPAPKPKETPKAAPAPAPQPTPAPAPQPTPAPAPQPTPAPKAETPVEDEDEDDCEIDIPDLLADAKGQGWCAEIFERNKRSVVTITIPSSGFDTVGTGFIISDKGYLLTNDHVVFDEDANRYHKKISIALPDSKKKTDLFVLFSDEKADIALCKFDPAKLGDFCAVQRIEDYGTVLQGADCLVIGNAFGMGLAPFTGIIRFTHNDSNDLVYTAPSNPGDSGGPVFNRSGLCIGINKSKTLTVGGTEADSYANATPMDKINSLLDKWIKANNITL